MTISKKKPTYSVVVPIHNSGPQLEELIHRLTLVFLETIKKSYEIILIDDGSSNPETLALLDRLAKLPEILVVNLTKNFGKPGAIMCGLTQSRGEWIVTIDDDLQQLPEDIPKLIEFQDHALVTATHKKKQHSLVTRFTSYIKQKFDQNILGYKVSLSPLKLIQRHVVDGMLTISTNRPFIPALIRQVTSDIIAIETTHEKTVYHKSRYSLKKRWGQFLNLLIGNSAFMMKAFAIIGFTLAAFSFTFAIVIITRKILGYQIQAGWASTMVAILFVGGVNLAAIGISGQYFIRILDISSKKPAFIVRTIKGMNKR